MSKNTIEIDLSSERLINLALEYIEDHKFLEALKMLNRHDDMYGANAMTIHLRANAYDSLYLDEMSIQSNYAYLNHVNKYGDNPYHDYISDAYSDLVANFTSIGEDDPAKYFLTKAIILEHGASVEKIAGEMAEKELFPADKPVYADVAEEIERIETVKDLIVLDKIDKALKLLDNTKKTDKSYLEQQLLRAHCYMFQDEYYKAIDVLEEVLLHHASYFDAGCLLVQAYLKADQYELAKKEVEKLISFNPESESNLQSVAYVACDVGMDAEAFDLLRQLHREVEYSLPARYLYAVSAYNTQRYNSCLEIMDSLATLYNKSEIIKYQYALMRKNIKERKPSEILEKLSYEYELPEEEYNKYLDSMTAYLEGKEAEATKTKEECFYGIYESEGGMLEKPIIMKLIDMLDKYKMDEYLEKMLMDLNLNMAYLTNIFGKLIERDEDIAIGYCLYKIYYYIKLEKIQIGTKYRKQFIKQYANAVARFAFFEIDGISILGRATEEAYKRLEEIGKLADCKKSRLLFAAIMYYGAKESKIFDILLALAEGEFNVKHDELLEFLDLPYNDEEKSVSKRNKRKFNAIRPLINDTPVEEIFTDNFDEDKDEDKE